MIFYMFFNTLTGPYVQIFFCQWIKDNVQKRGYFKNNLSSCIITERSFYTLYSQQFLKEMILKFFFRNQKLVWLLLPSLRTRAEFDFLSRWVTLLIEVNPLSYRNENDILSKGVPGDKMKKRFRDSNLLPLYFTQYTLPLHYQTYKKHI
jgi:hypothetical protein